MFDAHGFSDSFIRSFIHIEHSYSASSENYSEALPLLTRLKRVVLRWGKTQVTMLILRKEMHN